MRKLTKQEQIKNRERNRANKLSKRSPIYKA